MAEPLVVSTPVPVYAGDTTPFFSYTFANGGVPDDMSAWTWQAQWRLKPAAENFLTLDVDASLAATGVISISASAATTAQMTGSGVWDLQGTRGDEVRTWLRGTTVFTRDVTRG